jgi:hypothetical protein
MGNLEAARLLAKKALGAAKKRREINDFFKKQGFLSLGKGAWLGFRNRDVVSGCLIDGSPLDTYVETFILPAFDRHEFITWALGNSVVHCSPDTDTQEECEQAVNVYRTEMSNVGSSTDLVSFVDTRQIEGWYPIWVRYICYLRRLELDTAMQYLSESRRNPSYWVQREKFEEIDRFVSMRDADGVLRVLERWSAFSEKIFGPLDRSFSVYR